MFEMWNSVSSKLDQVHQTQTQPQQPHTSSGSIKGIFGIFMNAQKFIVFINLKQKEEHEKIKKIFEKIL